MTVVNDSFRLEFLQGIRDVVGRPDGGENFVEDATRLDVFLALTGLLVIARHEGPAAVALTEADLMGIAVDIDRQGNGGLEEGVL